MLDQIQHILYLSSVPALGRIDNMLDSVQHDVLYPQEWRDTVHGLLSPPGKCALIQLFTSTCNLKHVKQGKQANRLIDTDDSAV